MKRNRFFCLVIAVSLFACEPQQDQQAQPEPQTQPDPQAQPAQCDVAAVTAAKKLQAFTAPTDPGAQGLLISISGEEFSQTGLPALIDRARRGEEGEIGFVDGWELSFDHFIVTVDAINISENPDKVPSDQSQTGATVAQVFGPFAVDLTKPGTVADKGAPSLKVPALAALKTQNKVSGAPSFKLDERYAFGYDIIPASYCSKNVNLDADALALYGEMVEKGYTVMYAGTATWKGDSAGVVCQSSPAGYDYSAWPKTVKVKLGFTAPTSQLNCQNPDNQTAATFDGEEFQRGISVKSNESTVAQLTLHPDHPFWPNLDEGGTMHFDMIAAQLLGGAAVPTATLEALAEVSVKPVQDKFGVNLPWRSCTDSFDATTAFGNSVGMTFVEADGTTQSPLKLAAFMNETTSAQGHLNADGLCITVRK